MQKLLLGVAGQIYSESQEWEVRGPTTLYGNVPVVPIGTNRHSKYLH